MRFFVQFNFWMGILVFVLRCIEMTASTWPKKREPKTLQYHMMEMMIGLAVIVWAAFILWAI